MEKKMKNYIYMYVCVCVCVCVCVYILIELLCWKVEINTTS